MQFNRHEARQLLRDFEFESLFIEELGWDRLREEVKAEIRESEADYGEYQLTAVAEKRGMAVFHCSGRIDGSMPDHAARSKIQRRVAKSVHEHLIIYTDAEKTTQIWQSVRREPGKPLACREHRYASEQSGEALVQKLERIAFSLEEEESLTLVDVTGRVRAAFDVERITKKFYDRFKVEHSAFLNFLEGIPDEEMERWYASVMLNRLMFIYFIQKKGFLIDDTDYLRTKLTESKAGGTDRYYTAFLCPLFFEGFAKPESERNTEARRLLGTVPYLNGGIFQRHQLEELHGETFQIADAAFEGLFSFFEAYQWHLDDRPLRNDNEINPDVLGYIFEKYINQKQMGAYYTKEDITEYISKNTIIPFLLDTARENCKIAFTPINRVNNEGDRDSTATHDSVSTVWQLLVDNPDRYIYDAVKKGVKLSLPPEIAAGIDDVSARTEWNTPAPDEFALPTEIWREVVARRARYNDIHAKLSNGEIYEVNNLITYNLNIRQFAQDIIENCEGPELLRAFWSAITQVTVLDPTCGSGAFLFAALNILEPLYEACLDRMQVFCDELRYAGESPHLKKYADFREILDRVDEHPNRKYFILKSIIINNLYGVDIMEEAVEICKLRLFLKMVAQIEDINDIEPLPDIDFNIQAGNTLVGYAKYDEVERAVTENKIDFYNTMQRIKQSAESIERLFEQFRQQQTELRGVVTPTDKQKLQYELNRLKDELNRYLADEYEKDPTNETKYRNWLSSHKLFHWFVEFYGIIKKGGFDVIIGNPPYIEYRTVKEYYSVHGGTAERFKNLYAMVWERSIRLTSAGHIGFIIPAASVCTEGYALLRNLLTAAGELAVSSYGDNPGNLFKGIPHSRLSIILLNKRVKARRIFSTKYNRWRPQERDVLFQNLAYVDSTKLGSEFSIAKLGHSIELSILEKFYNTPMVFTQLPVLSKRFAIYYTRKLSHFVQILDFIPLIHDSLGNTRNPSELKQIWFDKEDIAYAILGFLNSSLFSWLITIHSDCRNLNKREILMARFNLSDKKNLEELGIVSRQLMENINANSRMVKQGALTIQQTYPRVSKEIIDRLDSILGQHYGLTADETNYLINYDIKYRMGLGSAA